MNVDLNAIEKAVTDKFTETVRKSNQNHSVGVEFKIAIAETSAQIMTMYLEEYLKATKEA